MTAAPMLQDGSSPAVVPASAGEVLLRVEDLKTHFQFGGKPLKAVDGVSFSVNRGEAIGLVGESGSGKTLTCLSIMRLSPNPGARIVGGRVLFQGQDLLKLSERDMRRYRGGRMAMIMQDPQTSLNPLFTVGEQVSEPIRLHLRQRGRKVIESALAALRSVRIPQPERRMGQYPHQFSGGMRQRVVAAMGLSANPELLIADEPTTSLDVTIQAQFVKLIKDLQGERGTSIIWVTHDLGIVAQTCDRVNVMYAGRVVESGPVRRIFKAPLHPYTRALLQSVPVRGVRRSRLYQIDGAPPAISERPEGCPFWPRCPAAMSICRETYPPRTSLGGEDFVHCWAVGGGP
jgi:oligopeptide transport system ATP-binding protein